MYRKLIPLESKLFFTLCLLNKNVENRRTVTMFMNTIDFQKKHNNRLYFYI